jgi:hypothetical protein
LAKNAGQVALEMGNSAGIGSSIITKLLRRKWLGNFSHRRQTRFRLASEGLQRGRQSEQRLSFDRWNQTEIPLPLFPLV